MPTISWSYGELDEISESTSAVCAKNRKLLSREREAISPGPYHTNSGITTDLLDLAADRAAPRMIHVH